MFKSAMVFMLMGAQAVFACDSKVHTAPNGEIYQAKCFNMDALKK